MNYQSLLIKEYNYWDLFLHQNQCYIGRGYLWAKRENAIDFIDTTDEERKEFFIVSEMFKQALGYAFLPDMFNYASLNNVAKHLHIHIIPRYKKQIDFNGVTFYDERWGENFAPYNKNFKVTESMIYQIKEKVKAFLVDI